MSEISVERAKEFRRRYVALCREFGFVISSYEETWITPASEWAFDLAGDMAVYGEEDERFNRAVIVPEGPDA